MHDLLEKLENDWRKNPNNKDVKAVSWTPGEERVKQCSEGCELDISGWDGISQRDAECQTRVCYEHGFVRIYVITGPTNMASNWSSEDDSF